MPSYNDYDEAMVDLAMSEQRKLKTAEEVIQELREPVEAVGPVNSLVELVKDYRGSTILEKVKDYIMCGGKPIEFYNIIEEQNIRYRVYKNNLKSMGAKSYKNDVKKKSINKDKYKKILLGVLATAIMVVGIKIVVDKNIRNNEYVSAVNTIEQTYIVDTIGIYNEGLEAMDISDLGEVDLNDFCQFLEDNGFGKYEIIYLTSEICGKESADIVCSNYGYKNLDSFLTNYFFEPTLSNSGETILQKNPSYIRLSNYVEESIKSKVPSLVSLIEQYKTGLGRKI